MLNCNFLNWICTTYDKAILQPAELKRLKDAFNELINTVEQINLLTNTSMVNNSADLIKDMRHTVVFIKGLETNAMLNRSDVAVNYGSMAPTHMDASFGTTPEQTNSMYEALKNATSVDIIGKSEFGVVNIPPLPNEVENYVYTREVDDGIYAALETDEIKKIFSLDIESKDTSGEFKIETYANPLVNAPSVSNLVIKPSKLNLENQVQWFGYDDVDSDLLFGFTGGSDITRVNVADLGIFFTEQIQHYTGRTFSQLVKRLNRGIADGGNIVVKVLPITPDVLLVVFDDQTDQQYNEACTVTRAVFDKYLPKDPA